MSQLLESPAFHGLKDIHDVERFDPFGKHAAITADLLKVWEKWNLWNWLGVDILHTHKPFNNKNKEKINPEIIG